MHRRCILFILACLPVIPACAAAPETGPGAETTST